MLLILMITLMMMIMESNVPAAGRVNGGADFESRCAAKVDGRERCDREGGAARQSRQNHSEPEADGKEYST